MIAFEYTAGWGVPADDVEQPSDISGILYLRVDPAGSWRYRLGRELAHIGLDADLNRLR